MINFREIESSLGLGSPTELYLFDHGGDRYAYTSGTKTIMHTDGTVYEPLPIERGKLQRTKEDHKNRLDIRVPGDSPIPMLFRNRQPTRHVSLRIFRMHRYTEEQWAWTGTGRSFGNEYRCIFAGEVIQSSWDNATATLLCAQTSALQRRQTLRSGYQSQCNNHLFDENCRLRHQDWQHDIEITDVIDAGFTLKAANILHGNEYYRGSLISVGGDDFRDVLSVDKNRREIKLLSPFDGLQPGSILQITKGCDRSAAACHSFDNFDNFFGCLTIPTENPFQ